MKSTRCMQTGMSILATLTIILVAGVFFSVAFKLHSPYFDYATIDSVLTDVIHDSEELKKSPALLKKDLKKKWAINQIRLPHKDSLIIRRKEGLVIFTLKYEARVPMFFNVDAMVKFDKRYEAKAP
ncbi:MAG: DUF4845 domain-containing protein [Neptuniibacter sp.]